MPDVSLAWHFHRYNSAMNYTLVVSAVLGLLSFGWIGILPGLALGYVAWMAWRMYRGNAVATRMEGPFVDASFAVLGAMSAARQLDDRDSAQLLAAFFARFQLDGSQRVAARSIFNRSRSAAFDIESELAPLRKLFSNQPLMPQLFVQLQLGALSHGGELAQPERALLLRCALALGMTDGERQQLEALLDRMARGQEAGRDRDLLAAYELLGVKPEIGDAELKSAYRKMIGRHHPDKLASLGLPASMRALAEDKTREITAAYDCIRRARAGS